MLLIFCFWGYLYCGFCVLAVFLGWCGWFVVFWGFGFVFWVVVVCVLGFCIRGRVCDWCGRFCGGWFVLGCGCLWDWLGCGFGVSFLVGFVLCLWCRGCVWMFVFGCVFGLVVLCFVAC